MRRGSRARERGSMKIKRIVVSAVSLLAGIVGVGQIVIDAQTQGGAQGAGAGRGRGAGANNSYLRGPAEKELIYVTLPGTLEGSPDANGSGIVVLDAKNNYNFVKR